MFIIEKGGSEMKALLEVKRIDVADTICTSGEESCTENCGGECDEF